jgi:uncharacterized damage-inducible protein DinB
MIDDEVYEEIADTRQNLMELLADLPADALSSEIVVDQWTAKDILIHIIAWDEICVGPLRVFAGGGAFAAEPIQDHNAWNQQQVERRAGLPLEAIFKEMTRVRLELLATAQRLDESKAQTVHLLPWGGQGTAAQILSGLAWHENEHAQEIEQWKQTRQK